MSTPAVRILIVRVGAMGDVLHGMPAVAALRHALPHAKIGHGCQIHLPTRMKPHAEF